MGLRTELRKLHPATLKNTLARFAARRTGRLLAPIIKQMADTGAGTEACLENRCLPMPVHYYSPVPDVPDLDQREIWARRTEMPGVAFEPAPQIELLGELGSSFGGECNWPQRSDSPLEFFTDNGSFSYGCAAITHCMIRKNRPQRVVEIGSGNSSLVIAKALELNGSSGAGDCDYTVIDPYPRAEIEEFLAPRARFIKKPVEQVEASVFEQLSAGDLLFIDSSHVVRIGGDVTFLYLEAVPRLAPGVIVHSHDIPLPYEYPRVYYTNPSFRVFWTEAYLLQALLTHSTRFRPLLGMCYLLANHRSEFADAFPHYDHKLYPVDSGSFWFQSVDNARQHAA